LSSWSGASLTQLLYSVIKKKNRAVKPDHSAQSVTLLTELLYQ